MIPWHPHIRKAPYIPGGSPVRTVRAVKDISLQNCKIRAFIPEGTPPEGWLVLLYIHGGGWTLGSIDTLNLFISRQCKENNCVSVMLDYRLAPENPYSAVVEDTAEFNANVNKIAGGGSSSGGNLAAITCLKAQELMPPIPITFQLLIVPVTDNTAFNTIWLCEGRMMWFCKMYLPDPVTWTGPDNLPIFASDALLAKVPSAFISVCELDILRDEGLTYGKKLKSLGVKVEAKVYPGVLHQIFGMDAALKVGKQQADDAIKAVGDAFKAA
ncbi:Alpha/Beta hydrolase protein [Suillus fuscotomentosus]|uniref:Alpha/Beta hydrolase protein n=1 Tax=Suillus fuscotomentosus TaxID=1912939 RepID=A0AAD4DQP8_9AGAM|nr:Alpha/Beta hydrolase protein [Suillus fuscotomentosus]KAG1886813.1 Alpha/Beta hydrolase protein [Suillus fuscotomentosus]